MFSMKIFLLKAAFLWTLSAAQTCSDLNLTIYQDPADIINYQYKSGLYNECPAETTYYEHHPLSHGGYKGCVSEKYFFPCAQDNEGKTTAVLYQKSLYNWNSTSLKCMPTGYTLTNRTFWVVSGDPLDKYELVKRTGFNPTVHFPLLHGTYPSYTQGVTESENDDTFSAKKYAYDFLVYLGGFKEADRSKWYVGWTEGAEQGMVLSFAAMGLSIAQTTCNRVIYVFVEAPSYGYGISDAAWFANRQSSTFYNGTECLCYATNTCKDPLISFNYVGWFPGNPMPVRMGGDGQNYTADSTSTASPWFESIVYPENPSGKLKTAMLPNPKRRVCDGCYHWPQYFGASNYSMAGVTFPDCSSWAFAITKGVSASIRAGFAIFKKDAGTFTTAMAGQISNQNSLTFGSYSQWSWMGQMQYWDLIKSRPLSDPTSWIGAYTSIMKEKWDALQEGFKDCPVITLTNPHTSAYAFFVMKAPYLGIQNSTTTPYFWLQVLGVQAQTYSTSFRGADPATFYGAGVSVNDFARLQLYRDVSVYKEIGRRAKIICANPDAKIGDFISVNQWVAANKKSRRALLEKSEDASHTLGHSKEILMNNHRDLTEAQAHRLAMTFHRTFELDKAIEADCAPEYTSSCRMTHYNRIAGDF